ncbi:unnamed protein product [Lampetra fluviatilis]
MNDGEARRVKSRRAPSNGAGTTRRALGWELPHLLATPPAPLGNGSCWDSWDPRAPSFLLTALVGGGFAFFVRLCLCHRPPLPARPAMPIAAGGRGTDAAAVHTGRAAQQQQQRVR